MGCKFSIQVDQPRPKTPIWQNKKTPRERKESTGSTQTEQETEQADTKDKVVAPDTKENLPPDAEEDEEKGYESSPEQVTIKTVLKTHRSKEKWKP